MHKIRWFVPLLAAAALVLPGQARAQLPSVGVYGVHTDASLGESDGIIGAGARVTIAFPVLPIDFAVAAEWFFPDCGQIAGEDIPCGMAGAEVDVNYAPFPIPMLTPYVSAGLVLRAVKPAILDPEYETETGATIGIGVAFSPVAIPFGIFVEGRRELVFDDQTIVRAGLQFGG